MKAYQILLFVLIVATFVSCEKDENPAEVTFVFTGAQDWNTVKNGEYLKVKVSIDYEGSSPELSVEQIDCYLGNRKIATEKGNNCEVLYKIEDATIGRHEFKAAALVTAPGFDRTYSAGTCDVNVEN